MRTQHATRGVQTLLVVGALTFAVVGLAAPQEESQQGACAVRNPDPPCNCQPSDTCWYECLSVCGSVAMSWCSLNPPEFPNCERQGDNYGLCFCLCGG
jgi:hypothetical protein